MIDIGFAIPGDINLPTGGYAYGRKMLQLLPDCGVQAHHLQLAGSFPFPDEADLQATQRICAQLRPDTPILFDGLAYGALPPPIVRTIRSPIVALVHHPLACETGLTPLQQRRFLAFERHALASAVRVIATSDATARLLMRDYDVAGDKIAIAKPGTTPALRAQGSGSPIELLAVGALIPRKGYTYLIAALADVQYEDWSLTIVGATDHDRRYAAQVREAILESGLRSKITLKGFLSDRELQACFARADVFVMPSLFEGYGMVLTEAVARGLPIVSTTGGAIAETVPDDVAIKVEPGNSAALADALNRVLSSFELRQNLSEASWSIGRQLPRWEDCAVTIAEILKAVATHAPAITNQPKPGQLDK